VFDQLRVMIAHAEAVEIAQEADVVSMECPPSMRAGGELVLAVGALDVVDAEGHHHASGWRAACS